MKSAKRDAILAQRKRYKRSAKHEAKVAQLVGDSLLTEGVEARKAIKRMMTHSYQTQVIQSADYSDKKHMTGRKIGKGESPAQFTRAKGNKTDAKINSYYAAKGRIPAGVL